MWISKASKWLSKKTLYYIYVSASILLIELYHIIYYKTYALLEVVTLL